MWWACEAFGTIRKRYFPGLKERDVLGLPALLRNAGGAPEPAIVAAEGYVWGASPMGIPMSTYFSVACGMGKLQQWARSKCLRAEDGGRVTLRAALQRLQGGGVENPELPVEEVEGSHLLRLLSSPMAA